MRLAAAPLPPTRHTHTRREAKQDAAVFQPPAPAAAHGLTVTTAGSGPLAVAAGCSQPSAAAQQLAGWLAAPFPRKGTSHSAASQPQPALDSAILHHYIVILSTKSVGNAII